MRRFVCHTASCETVGVEVLNVRERSYPNRVGWQPSAPMTPQRVDHVSISVSINVSIMVFIAYLVAMSCSNKNNNYYGFFNENDHCNRMCYKNHDRHADRHVDRHVIDT